MVQALGILAMLIGALMFHVAASKTGAKNIPDVWKDILKTLGTVGSN